MDEKLQNIPILIFKINNKIVHGDLGRPRIDSNIKNISGKNVNYKILILILTGHVDSGALDKSPLNICQNTRGRLSILHSPINKFIIPLTPTRITYVCLALHANEKSMLHLSLVGVTLFLFWRKKFYQKVYVEKLFSCVYRFYFSSDCQWHQMNK